MADCSADKIAINKLEKFPLHGMGLSETFYAVKGGIFMKKIYLTALLILILILAAGCTASGNSQDNGQKDQYLENTGDKLANAAKPVIPAKLKLNQHGIPILNVYQVDEEETKEMDIETYLEGVLAGEMKNDWPMEALKAQAILARTFVLKFCTEKESKYEGADISTDIEEAQAYDETGINERIEEAVKETEGLVLSHQGQLPYAWFHAHSGGKTALAKEGLAYRENEPGYTKVTDGNESEKAPEEAQEWTASFSENEVIAAAKKIGYNGLGSIKEAKIGETGESGRALSILINGESISAPDFRIALGSTKMRSTLLTSLEFKDGMLMMSGKGYGHGVGMPQWGAYRMAEDGNSAKEIVQYYFKDITVEKLW